MANRTGCTRVGYAGERLIRYRRAERMASLLIQPPDGEGERVELGEERILIGRGHDADLKVDDPTVSRVHVSLVKGPHGYVLSAEGARPIRVGGTDQKQLLLTHGVRFELGRTTFTFVDPRSAATEELPPVSRGAPTQPEDDEPVALPSSGAARFFRGALIVLLTLAVVAIVVHVFVAPVERWREWLAGSGDPESADAGVAELPPLDPSLELADPDAPLYTHAPATPRMELPLDGTPGTLVGELAEGGRRRILYGAPGTAEEEVFGAEFNLPAVGVSAGDRLFVCANRLVGRPSELTEGAMPDPRDGLELWCRARTSGDWSEPVRLSLAAAPWLVELQPGPSAVTVRYVHDGEGSLVGQPRAGDGLFAVRYDGERFGTPTLVTDYEPLAEPLPAQR
jgi:hypothetical protein